MINEEKSFSSLPGSEYTKQISAKKNIRRVLGIDPGLANTGFGVVDYVNGRYRMVSYGCITTGADEPDRKSTRLNSSHTS